MAKSITSKSTKSSAIKKTMVKKAVQQPHAKTIKVNKNKAEPEKQATVIVRIEFMIEDKRIATGVVEKGLFMIADEQRTCPDDKFNYSFECYNAVPHSLKVGRFESNAPGISGEFTSCVDDINEPPKIFIIAKAIPTVPGGSATLTMKYKGSLIGGFPKNLKLDNTGLLSIAEEVVL